MATSEIANWGHCAHCKYFGQHGAADASEGSERVCHEPELEQFDLKVTESAGCNHFEKAEGLSVEVEEPAMPPRGPTIEGAHTYH